MLKTGGSVLFKVGGLVMIHLQPSETIHGLQVLQGTIMQAVVFYLSIRQKKGRALRRP